MEQAIKDNPAVDAILKQFQNATIIYIKHYKDVFCRASQHYNRQQASHTLIIANKSGAKIYKGSPVCQSFDNEYFYYTSCMMNCIYNCEYCYLKGMYQSGYMVLFVNLQETFYEVSHLLKKHPVYLCVSYDTDLMAMENIFHLGESWCNFVNTINEQFSNKLTIEIRTKCGSISNWKNLTANPNVIFAFTISPEYVIDAYEGGTSSHDSRLACAADVMEMGFPVRLCFDPMIHCPDWQKHYKAMIDKAVETIDFSRLYDISIGSFRISKEYLKQMRRNMKDSAIANFPYENTAGFYHYPTDLQNEMEHFLLDKLTKHISPDKIFLWKE